MQQLQVEGCNDDGFIFKIVSFLISWLDELHYHVLLGSFCVFLFFMYNPPTGEYNSWRWHALNHVKLTIT